MPTTYRVERHWPHSPRRWAYIPGHENLTLEWARAVVAEGKEFEGEGMSQRIVAVVTKVVAISRSRRYSAKRMAGIHNLRGY